MFCNSNIFFSGTGDCWCRLASLINNLEKFQEHFKLVLDEPDESDPSKKKKSYCFVWIHREMYEITQMIHG